MPFRNVTAQLILLQRLRRRRGPQDRRGRATGCHAVREKAKVRVGEDIAVMGVGGLGSNAVQLARLAGCRIIDSSGLTQPQTENLDRQDAKSASIGQIQRGNRIPDATAPGEPLEC